MQHNIRRNMIKTGLGILLLLVTGIAVSSPAGAAEFEPILCVLKS